MQDIGFFKIYRELWEKPIWNESTPEQKIILITLLSMVNFKEKSWEWRGDRYTVKPGQVITSVKSIVERSGKGITVQNVRTALKRFENFGFLTIRSTNKNTLITIVNWDFYQRNTTLLTNQLTNDQLPPNQSPTTREESNNEKNNNIVPIASKQRIPYESIVTYLNEQSQKNFRSNSIETKALIKARIEEGYTFEDFKKVIDTKALQWLNNREMNKYLRPQTLFSKKFEDYLNEEPNDKYIKTYKEIEIPYD